MTEIASRTKLIRGINTQYKLCKENENSYEMGISRGLNNGTLLYNGDFFDAVALFKTMCETDTLPENLEDIAEDIKNFVTV